MQEAFGKKLTVDALWAPPKVDGALLGAALNAVEEAVAICRAVGGAGGRDPVVSVNAAFTRVFGIRDDEIVGRSIGLLWGERTDRALLRRARAEAIAGEESSAEVVLYRKRRMPIRVEQRYIPIPAENGSVSYYVVAIADHDDGVLREAALSTRRESLTKLTSIARLLF